MRKTKPAKEVVHSRAVALADLVFLETDVLTSGERCTAIVDVILYLSLNIKKANSTQFRIRTSGRQFVAQRRSRSHKDYQHYQIQHKQLDDRNFQ